ncbi:MAG: DNA-packaging protein [Allosphingosinicella sp.]
MSDFPLDLMREAALVLPDEAAWDWFLKALPGPVKRAIFHEWAWQAHGGQRAPGGAWRTWLLMAGRGFGKTRAGAEWVLERIREHPGARVALVGATRAEAAKVMMEGPSGLLALARPDAAPAWRPTLGVARFPCGAEAWLYSGANGNGLRGPEHHFAWCDELAKWKQADAAWDNLQMGLRLGDGPRAIVTTTPRAGSILSRVRGLAGTVETHGRTDQNAHLPGVFVDWATATYGGTRLGRQELDGLLFEEVAGALWTRATIEQSRVASFLPGTGRGTATRSGVVEGARARRGGEVGPLHHASHGPPPRPGEELKRIVVGVDPPASAEGDACGIVVCGMGEDALLYVLDDRSVAGERPEGWARAVARAAEAWGADRVVAEKNQGGDMVESVLRSAGAYLPVRPVSASTGKAARAEPVAALFEAGKAKLAGTFPELEDEMCGLTAGGGYEGPGRSRSPDRADAMVYAMTELMKPARGEPRIRQL